MTRAVLDTNVVVSALVCGGKPLALLQAATERDLMLFTSPALLDELRDVLERPHLRPLLQQKRKSVDRAIMFYAALAISVTSSEIQRLVPDDPDDDHVVAAALSARADLIISGDRHLPRLHSHGHIRIVTPRDAFDVLAV